jgi:hypothetical protein
MIRGRLRSGLKRRWPLSRRWLWLHFCSYLSFDHMAISGASLTAVSPFRICSAFRVGDPVIPYAGGQLLFSNITKSEYLMNSRLQVSTSSYVSPKI